MRLRDVDGWPPALTETYGSGKVLAATSPATLKRCMVWATLGDNPAYLSVVVHYQGRDWHAMITDKPAALLKGIEATLRGHEGEPLADLGNLEVIEVA